jgi:hypothetical protein
MLVAYTEYSTIQGLIYIFFPYQTIFGKVFWTITILLMLALGFYWCYEAYQGWVGQPVLTTITTTGLPVEKVRCKESALPIKTVWTLAPFSRHKTTFGQKEKKYTEAKISSSQNSSALYKQLRLCYQLFSYLTLLFYI